MTLSRPLLVSLIALAATFVVSWALYLLLPGTLTRVTLQFPHEIGHHLSPEARSLPFNWDEEHNVELLVREVLLGPARHDHMRLFSRDAELRAILVRNGNVYIDLKKASFLPDADVIYSPVKALEVLRTTLRDNIAGIGNVWISVDGEPSRAIVVDKG